MGGLQEFSFGFSELIQVVSHHKPKDISDPLKIYLYSPNLFNPAFSAKAIRHALPTSQKAIDNGLHIEREFLLGKGIQQTELETIVSIDAPTNNNL